VCFIDVLQTQRDVLYQDTKILCNDNNYCPLFSFAFAVPFPSFTTSLRTDAQLLFVQRQTAKVANIGILNQ